MTRGDLGFVLLVSVVLGLFGGTPFDHPDFVTGHVGKLVAHSGNPKFFNYPGLLIYLFALVYGTLFVLLYFLGYVHTQQEFKALIDTGTLISHPVRIPSFLPGHLVIVLFSFLGLSSIFLLTLRITKSRPAASLSVLAAGLSVIWVSNTHMLTVDIPSTALVIAAVASYVLATERPGRSYKDLTVSAALAGLATAAKYPSGLLVLTLVIAELARGTRAMKERFRRALFIGAVAVLVFLATNPFILLDFRTFWKDFGSELQHSAEGHHGFLSTGLAHHFVESLGLGLGFPTLVAGALGLALFAGNGGFSRHARLAIILFPIFHMTLISTSQLGFHRYALPAVPFLAFGIGYLARRLSERLHVKLLPIVGILLIPVLWHARSTVSMLRLLDGPDTRHALAKLVPSMKGAQHAYISTYASRVLDPERTSRATPPLTVAVLDAFAIDRHISQGCTLEADIVRQLQRLDAVVIVNPYSSPRAEVPYSAQSMYGPYPPDLRWRRMAGPYIEVYFDRAHADTVKTMLQSTSLSVLPAEDGFYRRALLNACSAQGDRIPS